MGGWARRALLTTVTIASLLFATAGVALAPSAHALPGGIVARSMAQRAQTAATRVVRAAERVDHGQLRVRAARPLVVAETEAESLPVRAYDRAVEIVAPAVDGLSGNEARAVVKVACATKDVSDALAQATLDEQLTAAGVSFGGRATYLARVRQLSTEMRTAQAFGDAAAQLAVFALCEGA